MKKKIIGLKKNSTKYFYILPFIVGILVVIMFNYLLAYTSTNDYCASCHIHPQATQSWKLGSHYDNKSGVIVACVDCHLPPEGIEYLYAKTTTGLRDIYGKYFKDEDEFNWELQSTREHAVSHTYKSACINCHQNLFPRTLNKKGEDAHLYYDRHADELRCINCHLQTGHYHEESLIEQSLAGEDSKKKMYHRSAVVDSFINFIETIPESVIDFKMIAIPNGEFKLGSPEDEEFRNEDEGPQKNIKIDQFWIGELEVTWDEYSLFMKETASEGRSQDKYASLAEVNDLDGITGPTPPYGNPGQGWGKGKQPAITMTHYAATVYCEWLSEKTGKTYRLPTEAEWEYACRANSEGEYFFEGNSSDYSEETFLNSIFGPDTAIINSFVIYRQNSGFRTHILDRIQANPFGLKNMLGNVKEFCSDFYSESTYMNYEDGQFNPKGPITGDERVVRGGSFNSDASDLRISNRDRTNNKAWLITDPQIPKSRWWYSDCNDVGFRVVCVYNEDQENRITKN